MASHIPLVKLDNLVNLGRSSWLAYKRSGRMPSRVFRERGHYQCQCNYQQRPCDARSGETQNIRSPIWNELPPLSRRLPLIVCRPMRPGIALDSGAPGCFRSWRVIVELLHLSRQLSLPVDLSRSLKRRTTETERNPPSPSAEPSARYGVDLRRSPGLSTRLFPGTSVIRCVRTAPKVPCGLDDATSC